MSRSRSDPAVNRFLSYTVLGLMLVALVACDSTESDTPDAERIVGTWDADEIGVRTVIGLTVPVFDTNQDGDVARFTFGAEGTYTFLLDPADGRTIEVAGVSIPLAGSVSLNGTYTLTESDRRILLTTERVPGGLTLQYRFQGNDELELIAEDPETLAFLLGLADEDVALLATVITGGSIQLRRSS